MAKYRNTDAPVGYKEPSGKKKVTYDADFRGFVNVNLSEGDKANFDAWSQSGSVWEMLELCAFSGIGLSVKREPKSGGFIASGMQRRSDSVNSGLIVTARGNSAQKAWLRLLFTLAFLGVESDWSAYVAGDKDDQW